MSATSRRSPAARPTARIAAWASFDTDVMVLVVHGSTADPGIETNSAEPTELGTVSARLEGGADGALHLVLVRLSDSLRDARAGLVLVDRTHRLVLDGPTLESLRVDPLVLVLDHIAPLAEGDRAAAMDLLVESIMVGAVPGDAVSHLLHRTRELLRPRPRPGDVDGMSDGRRGGVIERLLRVDDHTVYFRGWLGWHPDQIRELVVIAPEGERVSLGADLHRSHRDDVSDFAGIPRRTARLGIAARVTTVGESRLQHGWILHVTAVDGEQFEIELPTAVSEPGEVRDSLISEMALDETDDLVQHHLAPCLDRWAERVRRNGAIRRVEEYGPPPISPTTTVIVPLYGRIDYLEYQLAQFSLDAEFSSIDLLYVLDSPELAAEVAAWAPRLHRRYETSFRVAYLAANSGFAMANNLGASIARGSHLVLLNSDVLPEGPGWVSALRTALADADTDEPIGAVGPQLLYEDDSLQHCGMYFAKPAADEPWCNEHYFKGMHRSFGPASVARTVPALTAACLSIERSTFLECGGLDHRFIQGDYEDSDLCLRLAERGLSCWYAANVVLRHLEGGSYPSARRTHLAKFNRWLHESRWSDAIAHLMADPQWQPAAFVRQHRAGAS